MHDQEIKRNTKHVCAAFKSEYSFLSQSDIQTYSTLHLHLVLSAGEGWSDPVPGLQARPGEALQADNMDKSGISGKISIGELSSLECMLIPLSTNMISNWKPMSVNAHTFTNPAFLPLIKDENCETKPSSGLIKAWQDYDKACFQI